MDIYTVVDVAHSDGGRSLNVYVVGDLIRQSNGLGAYRSSRASRCQGDALDTRACDICDSSLCPRLSR